MLNSACKITHVFLELSQYHLYFSTVVLHVDICRRDILMLWFGFDKYSSLKGVICYIMGGTYLVYFRRCSFSKWKSTKFAAHKKFWITPSFHIVFSLLAFVAFPGVLPFLNDSILTNESFRVWRL